MHQLLIDLAKVGAIVFVGAIMTIALFGSGTLGEPFDVLDDDEDDRGGPGYYDF